MKKILFTLLVAVILGCGDGAKSNYIPVAVAGVDQEAVVGKMVYLDGSASYDLDGDALLYVWQFMKFPTGSAVKLSDPRAVRTTFIPDIAGEYVIRLLVLDNESGDTSFTTVRVK